MDLKNWFLEHKVEKYEQIGKSKVYCLFTKSSTFYLKKIDSIREFKIMEQLSKLSLPTFHQGILFKSNFSFKKYISNDSAKNCYKEHLYILSEKLKGENLYCSLDLPVQSFKNILDTIIFSLRVAWETLGFVHMDLHLGNIYIQKIDQPIVLETIWKSKCLHPILDIPNKMIVKDYLPVIIDFDMSVTKLYSTSYIHANVTQDIWHMLGILSLYLKNEKGKLVLDYIEHFLDRFEFQEKKEKFANEWFNTVPELVNLLH